MKTPLGVVSVVGFGDRHGHARVVDRAVPVSPLSPTGVRPIFVPPWVAEAVRSHADESVVSGRDLIFTIPRRTVQAEHSRACNLAGIFDYTIHDHKHTAAVALARAGIPLNLLQRQLGHKHIAMTMRYAQFHPDYSDTSIYFDRVGAKFGLLTPGNSSENTPAAPLGAEGAL